MTPAEILWTGLLAVNTCQDIRKREICLKITVCSGAAAFLWRACAEEVPVLTLAAAMIPGILCLAASVLSRGQIGAGDGIVVCAGGVCLGFTEIFSVLCLAFLAAPLSAVLFRGGRKGRREIPFIPFLLAAYVLERIGWYL